MKIFKTDREKRLWLWVILLIATIYSTIGLTGKLAGYLRENNLMAIAFSTGMLLVGGTIVVQMLKRKPGKEEIWLIVGVIAVYYMAAMRIESMEERTHLIEYSVVAIFILHALSERFGNERKVVSIAVMTVVLTALLGWVDEGIQYFVPNRVYAIEDVGFNAMAGLFAVAASLALNFIRTRYQKRELK